MQVFQVLFAAALLLVAVNGYPVDEPSTESTDTASNGVTILTISEDEELPASLSNSDIVEIDENDIPDGTLIMDVVAPAENEQSEHESLTAAENLVFRPLFRYRAQQRRKEAIRAANRRRYYRLRRRSDSVYRGTRGTGYYKRYHPWFAYY